MKRYLPLLLLLLLFASTEDNTPPPPPPIEQGRCEQWLQFSDGSVDVCTAGDQWSLDVRE